jgi:AraC family transcriptional regulator, exoenzyme S synthesis regulatory protein ExsA
MINYYELVVNNPAYFKQFSCKQLLFLNYDCPVNVKKAAKWSEHNYIYYVLSGKKTLHTIDKSVTLTKGSIAFIKKGACIVEQFFDEPFCIIVLIMPDSFLHSFLKDYVNVQKKNLTETPPVIPVFNDDIIQAFYQSILPYFVSEMTVPEEVLELKFRELLLHILHNPYNEELRNHLASIKENPLTPLKEIMDSNFAYNLTLEDYARITNRSISSFKRDFHAIYNTSPGRWLMEKKIMHAKELLIKTSDSVSDVAFGSGFENTAHFGRIFKQKTGLTPLEYRKRALVSNVIPA